MSDDSGFGLVVAVAIDVILGRAAIHHRWARVLNIGGILVIVTFIVGLFYVTFKYS